MRVYINAAHKFASSILDEKWEEYEQLGQRPALSQIRLIIPPTIASSTKLHSHHCHHYRKNDNKDAMFLKDTGDLVVADRLMAAVIAQHSVQTAQTQHRNIDRDGFVIERWGSYF